MVEPTAKRWRFQYSLRAFLLLTAILAVVVGGRLNRARKQQIAIQELVAAGGSFGFSSAPTAAMPPDTRVPTLTDLFFGQRKPVVLQFRGPIDTRLRDHIGCLTSLNHLALSDTDNSDAWYGCLDALSGTQTLLLEGPGITDEVLRDHISRLRLLQVLRLADTAVTDDGFKYLRSLPNLQTLMLQDSLITDAGLQAHVNRITPLTVLHLVGSNFTPQGLAELKDLRNLKQLHCARSSNCVRAISELTQPTMVNFTEVPLSEAVAYLSDLHGVPIKLDKNCPADLPVTATVAGATLLQFLQGDLQPFGLRPVVCDDAIYLLVEKAHPSYFDAINQIEADHPGALILIEWPGETPASDE